MSVRDRFACAGIVALVVVSTACADDESASTARQRDVAKRGAQVMPFDLDATTHTFQQTPDGGIQLVTADDSSDAEQVRLIRRHLREEQRRFAHGDYSDPARIHVMDMPGVAELADGYSRIGVSYSELADGAQLTYSTGDPELVDAVHAWFDRQVADHGEHATDG